MNNLIALEPLPPRNTNTTPKPPANTNANANANTTQVVIPQITNPFGKDAATVPGIANRTINVLLALIVIAAVVVIIISGFRMITGGSNPEQLKTAKRGIAWAIIGILVAFMSFVIVQIVQKLL
ncbi:MAG TPA: hypothetical protein VHQ41_02660 [Patescibacteria group bacterium]|jgi:amino acid transporter|nr:hypothetical protein [Patescibacteria group bacterium]